MDKRGSRTGMRGMVGVVLTVAMVSMLAAERAQAAGTPTGLNFGLGIGAHIPSDDYAYYDNGADLYPELQFMFDVSGLRFGSSAGYVQSGINGYYEQSFVPLKFNVAVLPVRFAKPNLVLQPYVGIGFGSYIATGDNDEDLTIVSGNAGFQFEISDWYNLSLDFAYNHLSEPDYEGYSRPDYRDIEVDLSYGTVMLVNRFRIPFNRSR